MQLKSKIYSPSSDSNIWSVIDEGDAVVMLGIQGVPGTKFQINASTGTQDQNYMTLGITGVLELDLRQTDGVITNLIFNIDETRLEKYTSGAFLMVDYLTTDPIIITDETPYLINSI